MRIVLGQRIPDIALAQYVYGAIQKIDILPFFARKRVVAIGVPGAFTPVCTKHHVPDFVAGADQLRASGFDELICIAANDPFTVAAWARQLDPENRIQFLADGNLEFTRAMGLQVMAHDLFLGERSKRYLMVVEDCIVTRLKAENFITDYCCTRPADAAPAAGGPIHPVD